MDQLISDGGYWVLHVTDWEIAFIRRFFAAGPFG